MAVCREQGRGVSCRHAASPAPAQQCACISCYMNFGAGKKAKAEPDPKQTAITQFFKKQKQ
jgi:hypothetical protein